MKLLITLLITLGLSFMATAAESWSVGQAEIAGKPVVYKFINELPDKKLRDMMTWLTVVSWKYDGSSTNGMPAKDLNASMIKLENGLVSIVGRGDVYYEVYTATGNNLKEFVFYITDRDVFMSHFNKALNNHPAYPIEISFYEDKAWSDLVKLHTDFGIKTNKESQRAQ